MEEEKVIDNQSDSFIGPYVSALPNVKAEGMNTSDCEDDNSWLSIEPKANIDSFESSHKLSEIMSLLINEQNKNKVAHKPNDNIEQGMLFDNSKEYKEMFKKSEKKHHHKKNENPDGKQKSSSPLNKDIEIYESSSKSSQDIKCTPLKNSDVKIRINDEDISHAVNLNFVRKQQDTVNDTDYANEVENTSNFDANIESSKDISSFGFDFSNLDISITKDIKATPGRKFPPIRIAELCFTSSNDKNSSSTDMKNSKSTYKPSSEIKDKSSKNLLFEFNKTSEK